MYGNEAVHHMESPLVEFSLDNRFIDEVRFW